ncbi:hypothetical protein OG858_47025 (plasmid) [Streptomyces europaeiscabiei]|uniref:hypothetical protein n=1 Tax=Streptomyces europaeiscabiei TaxID=146819 RepID=UPI002E813E58|nr:hypothetical protein [Streptomyces europaeiscabiei]WUD38861.1 hypothetical protein OG858_47025 [Streptomyces europaeiscabiei]
MTTYRAVLRFREDGPAVTGEWSTDTTPLQVYRQWVGIYGSDLAVTIQVTEENDGHRHTLRAWQRGAETQ